MSGNCIIERLTLTTADPNKFGYQLKLGCGHTRLKTGLSLGQKLMIDQAESVNCLACNPAPETKPERKPRGPVSPWGFEGQELQAKLAWAKLLGYEGLGINILKQKLERVAQARRPEQPE